MVDMRVIKCINPADNMSLILRRTSASPWYLSSFSGLYELGYDVNTTDNTLTDGSQYFGTLVKERNITLSIVNRSAHRNSRNLLYSVFRPRTKGILEYSDGVISREIGYYAESCNITTKGMRSDDSGAMTATVSLICPDPFFYDLYDSTVRMSSWVGAFTFQHTFSSAGEEFGYRTKEKLQDIVNESGLDDIGMTIRFDCSGSVTNPLIINSSSGETCRVGTDSKPLSLVAGDVLEITTGTGNRHVYFTHDGVKTEANYYLSSDSVFPMIHTGHNVIGYNASSGVDNMSITITYRMRYSGV